MFVCFSFVSMSGGGLSTAATLRALDGGLAERRIAEFAERFAHFLMGLGVLGFQFGDSRLLLAFLPMTREQDAESFHVDAGLASGRQYFANSLARPLALVHVLAAQ